MAKKNNKNKKKGVNKTQSGDLSQGDDTSRPRTPEQEPASIALPASPDPTLLTGSQEAVATPDSNFKDDDKNNGSQDANTTSSAEARVDSEMAQLMGALDEGITDPTFGGSLPSDDEQSSLSTQQPSSPAVVREGNAEDNLFSDDEKSSSSQHPSSSSAGAVERLADILQSDDGQSSESAQSPSSPAGAEEAATRKNLRSDDEQSSALAQQLSSPVERGEIVTGENPETSSAQVEKATSVTPAETVNPDPEKVSPGLVARLEATSEGAEAKKLQEIQEATRTVSSPGREKSSDSGDSIPDTEHQQKDTPAPEAEESQEAQASPGTASSTKDRKSSGNGSSISDLKDKQRDTPAPAAEASLEALVSPSSASSSRSQNSSSGSKADDEQEDIPAPEAETSPKSNNSQESSIEPSDDSESPKGPLKFQQDAETTSTFDGPTGPWTLQPPSDLALPVDLGVEVHEDQPQVTQPFTDLTPVPHEQTVVPPFVDLTPAQPGGPDSGAKNVVEEVEQPDQGKENKSESFQSASQTSESDALKPGQPMPEFITRDYQQANQAELTRRAKAFENPTAKGITYDGVLFYSPDVDDGFGATGLNGSPEGNEFWPAMRIVRQYYGMERVVEILFLDFTAANGEVLAVFHPHDPEDKVLFGPYVIEWGRVAGTKNQPQYFDVLAAQRGLEQAPQSHTWSGPSSSTSPKSQDSMSSEELKTQLAKIHARYPDLLKQKRERQLSGLWLPDDEDYLDDLAVQMERLTNRFNARQAKKNAAATVVAPQTAVSQIVASQTAASGQNTDPAIQSEAKPDFLTPEQEQRLDKLNSELKAIAAIQDDFQEKVNAEIVSENKAGFQELSEERREQILAERDALRIKFDEVEDEYNGILMGLSLKGIYEYRLKVWNRARNQHVEALRTLKAKFPALSDWERVQAKKMFDRLKELDSEKPILYEEASPPPSQSSGSEPVSGPTTRDAVKPPLEDPISPKTLPPTENAQQMPSPRRGDLSDSSNYLSSSDSDRKSDSSSDGPFAPLGWIPSRYRNIKGDDERSSDSSGNSHGHRPAGFENAIPWDERQNPSGNATIGITVQEHPFTGTNSTVPHDDIDLPNIFLFSQRGEEPPHPRNTSINRLAEERLKAEDEENRKKKGEEGTEEKPMMDIEIVQGVPETLSQFVADFPNFKISSAERHRINREIASLVYRIQELMGDLVDQGHKRVAAEVELKTASKPNDGKKDDECAKKLAKKNAKIEKLTKKIQTLKEKRQDEAEKAKGEENKRKETETRLKLKEREIDRLRDEKRGAFKGKTYEPETEISLINYRLRKIVVFMNASDWDGAEEQARTILKQLDTKSQSSAGNPGHQKLLRGCRAKVYFWIGVIWWRKKNPNLALQYFQQAERLGFTEETSGEESDWIDVYIRYCRRRQVPQ